MQGARGDQTPARRAPLRDQLLNVLNLQSRKVYRNYQDRRAKSNLPYS